MTRQRQWEEQQAQTAPSPPRFWDEEEEAEMEDFTMRAASQSGTEVSPSPASSSNNQRRATARSDLGSPIQRNQHLDPGIDALLAAEAAEMEGLVEMHEASQQQSDLPETSRMHSNEGGHHDWRRVVEAPGSEALRYGVEDDSEFERALAAFEPEEMDQS